MEYETKDSGERQVFSTDMQRDTQNGKPRYDLIVPLDMSPNMLDRWADLMARGAEKYTERNWEKASTQEELDRFRASAFRHFMQWFEGKDDEDHASAIFFNVQGVEYVKGRLNDKP